MKKIQLTDLFFVVILGLFLFTRIFNIQNSLLYINDMGRDSLVLLDWKETGKPPLLGPQTSALPFNQSAFFFYLLYPIFLLTDGSPFSSLITVNIFYVVIFAALYIWIRKKNSPAVLHVLLLSLLLITLHPQFIIQNRFVWNPSFVGPLLLTAFFSFYFLTRKFERSSVLVLGLTLALATSLSYSVAPTLIGFGIASLVYFRKKSLFIGLSLVGWLGFFNLPTLFFELRHGFLLTKMMLFQPKVKQLNADFASKVKDLVGNTLTTYPASWQNILVAVFIISVLIGLWMYWKKASTLSKNEVAQRPLFILACLIFFSGLVVNLLFPVPLLSHYIFGIVTIGVLIICSLPHVVRNSALIVLIGLWAVPLFTQQYFVEAERTVPQMQGCYQRYCQNQKESLFVSVQSGILPFHNGPDHRFLLRQAGCNVKSIETELDAAQKMAIVVESSNYSFGQTIYPELDAFKPTQVEDTFSCQSNLEIVTVKR